MGEGLIICFSQAYSISAGAASSADGYPTIYVLGVHSGTSGAFSSDDQGSTWTQINDAEHGFGSISSGVRVLFCHMEFRVSYLIEFCHFIDYRG